MTRINTNVASLTAQKTLARSNVALQEALTRLSTGLRINSGKDDPAGLIASEMLRSDIVSTNKAISNSERANQIIATADAALSQINGLLNDIRGLVTEAANTGAMSADQIAANQLQIDSSLEAINRIAQTANFQGRRLLDGTLDFVHTAGSVTSIIDVQIEQANLGTAGSMTVDVDIATAAAKAQVLGASGTTTASTTLNFRPGAAIALTSGAALNINATSLGDAEDGVTITFNDTGSLSVSYDADAKTLDIGFQAGATTVANIVAAVAALDEFDATEVSAGTLTTGDDGDTAVTDYDSITITAATEGADYNNVRVSVVTQNGLGAGNPTAAYYSDTKNLVITIDDTAATTLANIAAAINALSEFSATASAGGDASVDPTTSDANAVANTGISGYLNTSFSAATNASATLEFAPSAALTFAASAIDIKATSVGSSENNVAISMVADGTAVGSEYAEYDSAAKTLKIHINNAAPTTAANVAAAIDALDEFEAFVVTAGAVNGAGADANVTATTDTDQLNITALIPGADYNHVQVLLVTDADQGATPTASYDATNKILTITIDDTTATDLDAIDTAIDALEEFASSHRERGATRIRGNSADVTATANTNTTGGNTLLDDVVFQLSGSIGTEVFNFQQGASVNQVVDAINLLSDATGVTASQSAGLLTLQSNTYGSAGLIELDIISEGTNGTFETALSANRATGTDIVATVNGVTANGSGNTLSVNTSVLDLSITVTDGSSTDFEFTISGGGALFQLGPDVVSTQQARMGIPAVNTATLRGQSGRLYQLGSGESAALATDPSLAAQIVDEVITKVASLRGRLGAFQKSTLETNINSLKDTVEKLTEAESTIRDADFAAETAALTRAQILVQSGTSVLAIANSQPQNVLNLLR